MFPDGLARCLRRMIAIRHYEPADRAAVRRISCDTADAGRPPAWFDGARELLADLLTCYHTDCEPQSLWVAERDGRVAGYLAGMLDTRRAQRIMARRIWPAAFSRAVAAGLLANRPLWRLAWHNRRLLAGPRRAAVVDLQVYPAQLHVNLDAVARGCGIGGRLLAAFAEQARAAGASGLHAWVRADNAGALAFFVQAGFRELGRRPWLWRDERTLLDSVGMARRL